MEEILVHTYDDFNPPSYTVKFGNKYDTPPVVTINCNPSIKVTKFEIFTDRVILSFDPKPKTFVCIVNE